MRKNFRAGFLAMLEQGNGRWTNLFLTVDPLPIFYPLTVLRKKGFPGKTKENKKERKCNTNQLTERQTETNIET